ncbi:hypothetical protein Bbelb_116470 [Branchiostoma belcheri]|nr:hypothetical protein Bbelb_116470 [Branchiostoma belcheri]
MYLLRGRCVGPRPSGGERPPIYTKQFSVVCGRVMCGNGQKLTVWVDVEDTDATLSQLEGFGFNHLKIQCTGDSCEEAGPSTTPEKKSYTEHRRGTTAAGKPKKDRHDFKALVLQDVMGRKLRHVLIFLLIILKEPNMPEADCSASCVKHWYYPRQGQSQTITESDTSTTAVVVTSGLDHEYEDIDQHNQTRQDRSWVITESNRKTPSVITRRDSDHQYEDVDRHNQKRQGQAQTIPTSNTKQKML